MLFRSRDKIAKLGNYRNFPASQDYDLWLRACCANFKFYIINEYLIKYRIRGNNISNKNPLKQWVVHEYIFKLYKQRMKNGKDTFSTEDLNNYLENNKVLEEQSVKKFRNGMENIEKWKRKFKEKKILSSFYYFIKAIFCHRKIKNVIYNYALSYLIKRKGKHI